MILFVYLFYLLICEFCKFFEGEDYILIIFIMLVFSIEFGIDLIVRNCLLSE